MEEDTHKTHPKYRITYWTDRNRGNYWWIWKPNYNCKILQHIISIFKVATNIELPVIWSAPGC